jgi:hypothetical protein
MRKKSRLGRKLNGLGPMASFWLGADTPKTRRRMSALLHEVAEEDRLPFFRDGGQPCSYEGWLEEYARRRRQNGTAEKDQADC